MGREGRDETASPDDRPIEKHVPLIGQQGLQPFPIKDGRRRKDQFRAVLRHCPAIIEQDILGSHSNIDG
jgi:hypothetical protein